jgi:hypothetical protein
VPGTETQPPPVGRIGSHCDRCWAPMSDGCLAPMSDACARSCGIVGSSTHSMAANRAKKIFMRPHLTVGHAE